MNRGQHRKSNAVIEFLKKKPVYLSAVGILAIAGVSVGYKSTSHALTPLQSDGGFGAWEPPGTDPATNGGNGIGGTNLFPQMNSPDFPSYYKGWPAMAQYYDDTHVSLVGPTGSSMAAWLLHVDVVKNTSGTSVSSNNGYEMITDSMISTWAPYVDGYSSRTPIAQDFDNLLKSEVEQQYATFTKGNLLGGGGSYQLYDLPTLIKDAGGAWNGRYWSNKYEDGPTFYWTSAPQAQIQMPVQTITGQPGSDIYFDDEVKIQSYNAKYHYEYVDLRDETTGTAVQIPASDIHLLNTAPSSQAIYQTPGDSSSPKMVEVKGGNPNPGSVSPRWYAYTNGNSTGSNFSAAPNPTGGQTMSSVHDYIHLPSNVTLNTTDTYEIEFWASDYWGRVVTATPATFKVTGAGGSNGAISLTVNGKTSDTVKVGQSVTLQAKVNTQPPAGQQWYIEIEDMSGSTINGSQKIAQDSLGTPMTFNTSASSSSPLNNEMFKAFIVDQNDPTYTSPSNPVTATWTPNNPPPGGGGGGLCPAPYDSNETWTSNGNGNETFSWIYNVPYAEYRNTKNGPVFIGCGDNRTQMSQYYPATETQGQISGLSYDPGTPGNMWLPTSGSAWATQATGSGFWAPMDQQHGWDWLSNGSPSASQVSGSYFINGTQYNSYGPGQGSTPWAWARPASGFGFRIMWKGSPHSLPTNGTVTFTMTNPDGSSKTWNEPLIINSDTLNTQGTQMPGLNIPPPFANEYYSAWTEIPKTMTNEELAAWSLSGSSSTALANGAHISVAITFGTQNAGNISMNVPTMIALFNYPAWFFNSIGSNDLSQAAAR